MLDLSDNENFDDNIKYHGKLTEGIKLSTEASRLKRIVITTMILEVKAHYLELIEYKPSI